MQARYYDPDVVYYSITPEQFQNGGAPFRVTGRPRCAPSR